MKLMKKSLLKRSLALLMVLPFICVLQSPILALNNPQIYLDIDSKYSSHTNSEDISYLIYATDDNYNLTQIEWSVTDSMTTPTSYTNSCPYTEIPDIILDSGMWYIHVRVTNSAGASATATFGPYFKDYSCTEIYASAPGTLSTIYYGASNNCGMLDIRSCLDQYADYTTPLAGYTPVDEGTMASPVYSSSDNYTLYNSGACYLHVFVRDTHGTEILKTFGPYYKQ